MNKSDFFSYLSAFVTVVLAVAMTDLIQSTHRLIRARRRIKWDVLPLIFACAVALLAVSEFFSLWETFAISEVAFPRLLWMLAVPIFTALLAYSALPDEVPEIGLDLTEFFHCERRSWAVILGIMLTLDFLRTLEFVWDNAEQLRRYLAFSAPIEVGVAICLALMWFAKSRRVQLIAVCGILAIVLYGVSGSHIAARPG